MKKTSIFLLIVCLICSMAAITAFGAEGDFCDTFENGVPAGWTFENANNDTAGTIVAEDYIMDSSKKALTFTSSGTAGKTLAAYRTFDAKNGNFVIDFEIAFKAKGGANFLYAYNHDSKYLFTMVADGEGFTGYVGTGNYDNTATPITYLESYEINKAYHIQIAINSDKQIFNVYINGAPAATNIPLRNKITTGMTKTASLQAGNSTAVWQLVNYGIHAPEGTPAAVSNVSINKIPYIGEEITANYTYGGEPEDDFSTVKWMYSDSENGTYKYIPGANEKTFKVTPYVAGKWIKAEVTPGNGLLATATPVYSTPVFDRTIKTISLDENSTYAQQSPIVTVDAENALLTFTPTDSKAAVATVAATPVTGTVVFEASVKNKTKSASTLIYVHKDSGYVFNITFDANNLNLLYSSVAGENKYTSKALKTGYVADTWYNVKAIIDTATSTADFYVDDVLVIPAAGLRANLSTKGITSMTLTGTAVAGGETYIKDMKLYAVSAPKGTPAVVSNVSIDKTPYLGREITVNYTYGGEAEDDFSTVKWMYSDSENGTYKYIDGANEKSFTITPYIAGKWIKAEVIPCNGMLESAPPVYSAPVLDKTVKAISLDENSTYAQQSPTVTVDAENAILTFTPANSKAAVATVQAAPVTGTVIFEASVKNKTKSASSLIYVHQDSGYVFNVTFDKNNLNLLYSSVAGENKYTSKALKAGYVADTWYNVKAIIDTATSTADFYVDDVLVIPAAGLRANLSTKGITSMTLTGTTDAAGETYIKGMKLYAVSAPETKATSAKIEDAVVYTINGSGNVTLKADLFNQLDEKVEGIGFSWELAENVEGVTLTEDGILIVDNANVEAVAVKATSNDDASIIAEKVISIKKSYEITNFAFSTSDGQPVTTLDRSVTVTANANVEFRVGSRNATMLMAFYNASGKLMYAVIDDVNPEYNVPAPLTTSLTAKYNEETAGGFFKAFVFDTLETLAPLANNISTAVK